MSARSCRDLGRSIGPYLDGELEAAKLLEIDEHVARCEACREEAQLLRAMRGSLRRVVRTPSPEGLRARIATAMVAERAREEAREDRDEAGGDLAASALPGAASASGVRGLGASWRTMVPLASAAALALVWGAATRTTSTSREAHAGFGDDLLAELVAEHTQPLPMDATDQKSVRTLEQHVGVPIHPTSCERAGARFIGGRVVPVRSQRAAMLQCVLGAGDKTQRLSILVYDAQKIQIGTSGNWSPHAVGTAEVRVRKAKGYTIAATQNAGVGYMLASDLDTDRAAQLAAQVNDDR